MKRLGALLCCLVLLCLCGCGIYESEYHVEESYVPPAAPQKPEGDRVTVRNFSALRQAVQNLVNEGHTEGSIIFVENYEGVPAEDMANACWQVRTQNALCAYCVENISYEMSTVLTNEEAAVTISYGDTGCSVENIVRKNYATGIDADLQAAMEAGREHLVLLISYSTYSATDMESYLSSAYRAAPLMSPREPNFTVNMYSGTGMQRLYDVSIDYRLTATERQARMDELQKMQLIADLDVEQLPSPQRALALAELMAESCTYNPDGGKSVYDALVLRNGGSEALALGFAALAGEMGIDCVVVYGQYNWQEHCWNIIELEGQFYHVDISRCIGSGVEAGFLKNDMQMWGSYRWNTADYDKCDGSLSYPDIKAAE